MAMGDGDMAYPDFGQAGEGVVRHLPFPSSLRARLLSIAASGSSGASQKEW